MYIEPPSKSIVDASYENIVVFLGGLSFYSVLFKATLNNANMQRNWFHGFRSLNFRGWIKGALVSRCLCVAFAFTWFGALSGHNWTLPY